MSANQKAAELKKKSERLEQELLAENRAERKRKMDAYNLKRRLQRQAPKVTTFRAYTRTGLLQRTSKLSPSPAGQKNIADKRSSSVSDGIECLPVPIPLIMENNVGNNAKSEQGVVNKALEAVLVPGNILPGYTDTVKGYNWEQGLDYSKILESLRWTGFQATNFGLAVEEINKMLSKRSDPLSEDQLDFFEDDQFIKRKSNCTIFLGYTSNMISSGIRDTIRFLVQHKMVDCIVTSAGGVEEDFIKCLCPTYVGSFDLGGKMLREKGVNRIGNLLVPNDNYCKFEDWVMPLLDSLLAEQKEKSVIWTPSKVIEKLGLAIDNPDSVYYWAAKNKIPVFCPALTDGSLGDMMYFHSYKNPGLVIDILQDLRRLNTMAVKAVNTGMLIIGGSVIKHHICNANLMRNGADFAVFINTGSDFDGSDSGAKPDEAVSWGKIRKDATPVKICAEASLIFPLLVGETFAKAHFSKST